MSEMHKPTRNWRGYLKEYAIIVIGVLTALAAQQAVDWWHWRSEVAQARQVIASETAQNLAGAIRRMRTVQCGERRLDALGRILDEAARTGRLPPVGYIGQPPRGMQRRGAWDSVVASQTATHFSRQEIKNLADLYVFVDRTSIYQNLETEAWSSLYAIVGPGRRLDPASEAELRKALGSARNTNRTLAQIGTFMALAVKSMALPFNPEDLEMIRAAQKTSVTGDQATLSSASPMSLICGPIGPVPAAYGEAQNQASPALIEEAAKALPDFGEGAR
jgi:hypothetical protein